MHIIAQHQDFTLTRLDAFVYRNWISYKLTTTSPRKGKGRRGEQNWWLKCNGQRLAKSRDQQLLAHFLPDIHQWVLTTLLPGETSETQFIQVPPLWNPAGDDSAWMQ